MEFKVTYADGTVADGISVIPSAIRAVESEYGKPINEVSQTGFSGWIDLVCWTYVRARLNEDRPLEEWLDSVDKIEIAQAAKPTPTSARKRSASSGQRSTKAKTSTD
jgi:hypothetical protein